MHKFRNAIESEYRLARDVSETGFDENLMIISFDCENLILSKEDLSIPYVICLKHGMSAVVYQVASIFYRSKENFTTSTIVTRTYDCKWIMFHWLPGKEGVSKNRIEHVSEKTQLRFRKTIDKIQYFAEGIIFKRTLDQQSVIGNLLSDTLDLPCVCRIKGSLYGKVLAESVAHIEKASTWIDTTIIEYILEGIENILGCSNTITNRSTLLVYDQQIQNHFLSFLRLTRAEEKLLTNDQRKEHILKRASMDYTDLTNWERIYEYIDKCITSNLATIFSKRFFFFPLNVNSNHWILMVASIETKEVFIVDSKNSTGRLSSYSYLVSILLKYFQYKSTLPDSGFLFNEKEWSIKSLPCAEQKDGSSCGIFTFLNAAKLMKQIHENTNVKISCVESPLREYTREELLLLRETVKNVLLNRMNMEHLVAILLKDDLGIVIVKAPSPKKIVKKSKVKPYEEE